MPVYEYVCTVCGHPVEVMHSFTAEGPKSCERCGSPMRKMLSTPAIVFKGSGWAKKDHRDKVHASSKPAVTPAATTDGSGGTGAVATTGDGGPASSSAASSGDMAAPAPATPVAPAATSSGASTSPKPATSSSGSAASSG